MPSLSILIKEYLTTLTESYARSPNPVEEPLIVEPPEARRIIDGHYVFQMYTAYYGAGKSFHGYYVYHYSRLKGSPYVTYVSLRNIPPEARPPNSYLDVVFEKFMPNVRRTNTLADMLLALILTPHKVVEAIPESEKAVFTTLPESLTLFGKQVLEKYGVEESFRALELFTNKLSEYNKTYIVMFDEFEEAIITGEELDIIVRLAESLRLHVYDKVGPRLKVVIFVPPQVSVESSAHRAPAEYVENEIRNKQYVQAVSWISELRPLSESDIKQYIIAALERLGLRDSKNQHPLDEKVIDNIARRFSVYVLPRIAIPKLRAVLADLLDIILTHTLYTYGLDSTNIDNINTLREAIDMLRRKGFEWRRDIITPNVVFEHINKVIPKEVQDVAIGRYSEIDWVKVLDVLSFRLTRRLSRIGPCIHSIYLKKKGYISYILLCKEKTIILWFRASDLRADRRRSVIKTLKLEDFDPKNTLVLCLHPVHVRLHTLYRATKDISVKIIPLPLSKEELIGLVIEAYKLYDKIEDPELIALFDAVVEKVRHYVERNL